MAGLTVPSAFTGLIGEKPTHMRVSVICDACGMRHRLLRPQKRGTTVWLMCHHCETPMWVRCPA